MKAFIVLFSTFNAQAFAHSRRFGCLNSVRKYSKTIYSELSPESCTVDSIFSRTRKHLETNGVEDSEDSARYLLTDVIGIGYRLSEFDSNRNKRVTPDQLERLQKYCDRRILREPIQYIIGNWDFFGRQVECRAPILIPRPETEELVEKILSTGLLQRLKEPRILDIGCGSGVIGITLAAEVPGLRCISVDLSPEAVQLTSINAGSILGPLWHTRLQARHQSFLDFVSSFLADPGSAPFDLIVSNPPYIPSREMADLQAEVLLFEDRRALDGGEEGLDVVNSLVDLAPLLLKPPLPIGICDGGGGGEMWLEVDHTHPEIISSRSQSPQQQMRWDAVKVEHGDAFPDCSRGLAVVSTMHDLAGRPRFVRFETR